jgi:hypothetical protein
VGRIPKPSDAGLVPTRRGPKGSSELTPQLVEGITGLDAAGPLWGESAAATGVSAFSVHNALGRIAPDGRFAAGTAEDSAGLGGAVPVLPDSAPRDGERVLARWGWWAPGRSRCSRRRPATHWPGAAGAARPEATGLLDVAPQVYGRLKDEFTG